MSANEKIPEYIIEGLGELGDDTPKITEVESGQDNNETQTDYNSPNGADQLD